MNLKVEDGDAAISRIIEARHAAEQTLDAIEELKHAYMDVARENDSRGEEIVRLKAELKAIRREWLQLNASSWKTTSNSSC